MPTSRLLLAGLLMTAGLPPYPWTGALVVVGLAMLARELVDHPHPGRAVWLFALAHQTSLLYWLFLLDPAKSIPSRALVPAQAAAAILYVSLFYFGLGWFWGRARRRLGVGRALLLFPVLWTLMEDLRARGELGFPWCLSGAAVLGTPLLPLVRAGGELAVGTALAASGVALASLVLARSGKVAAPVARGAVALACSGWVLLAVGAVWKPAPPTPAEIPGTEIHEISTAPLKLAAVQADVALADKWVDARIDSTKEPYAELTIAAARDGAQLIVWAETALPAYLRYDNDLLGWTRDLVRDAGAYVYTGFPDAERGSDGVLLRYNSSALLSPLGTFAGSYAKHHLLPIGESMPFQRYLPFLGNFDVGQAEWDPGRPPAPLIVRADTGDFPFAGLICFESAFASLARGAVRDGARCLAVITNDGWFGESAGPRQHAALARLRAVECDVPVVRCANNGVSFICDARGRDLGSLDLGRRGYVLAEVSAGGASSVFVRWGWAPLFGVLFFWTLGVVLLVRREARG